MPNTRKTEASSSQPLSEDKFQKILNEKLDKLHESMATKDCIKQLSDKIDQQNEKIDILEAKVAVMERYIRNLEQSVDDQEQYHRRLCLRIEGIPAVGEGKSESGEQCLTKVKQMFKKLNVNVPDAVIDRAHRIGNRNQMIVRFTTWRHRTLVYRARKKPESPYKIRLDLTKKRLSTVIATNDVLQAKNLGFSFADVNCRLCAKIGDKFHYFSDEEDFKALLAKLNIDIEDVDSESENGEPEAEEQPEGEAEVVSASEE